MTSVDISRCLEGIYNNRIDKSARLCLAPPGLRKCAAVPAISLSWNKVVTSR